MIANTNNADAAKYEKPQSFIKEVAKYFMSFLETDFKKRRIPKRNTIQKTQNGLQVGFDLEKYPKLKKDLIKLLNSGFKKDTLLVKKGKYIKTIPRNLNDLIESKILNLQDSIISDIAKYSELAVKNNLIMYQKEYDRYLEESVEEIKTIFNNRLILPLLDDLDKPLENLDLADVNSKYQLEIEISESVFDQFEERLTEALRDAFQQSDSQNIARNLIGIFDFPEIQRNMIVFFTKYAVGDAFTELYALYRNNRLIDKTETYVYFYELTFEKLKFPIFYIPVSLDRDEHSFLLHFEKRLFLNTKAIDFVVQEFNKQTNESATLAGEFDRIMYIELENDFLVLLKNIIQKLEAFFGLNKNIDLSNPKLQTGINILCHLSNRSFFYLFDKSDEALINDYEEILSDDGSILENYTSLLHQFIEENPIAFMSQVDDEWHSKKISEKLIVESPIPLNDEQKKVLIALQKQDCHYLILEGPPGTGKSHTITAIICKALLEERSVLVLSDKKEALDVVEDKITGTLNKIRHEDDFQNPILRLGRSGSKFSKIVQGHAIQKIKEHYNAYKYKKDDYDKARDDYLKNIGYNISEIIQHCEGIHIEDIVFYFTKSNQFKSIEWFKNTEFKDIEVEILKVHESTTALRNNNWPYKSKYVSKEFFDRITELKDCFSELEQLKGQIGNLRYFEEQINKVKSSSSKEDHQLYHTLNILKEECAASTALNKTLRLVCLSKSESDSLSVYIKAKEQLRIIEEVYNLSRSYFISDLVPADLLKNLIIPEGTNVSKGIAKLEEYLTNLKKLRNPLFGYLFKSDQIATITLDLKKNYYQFNDPKPEKKQKLYSLVLDLFKFIASKILEDDPSISNNDDYSCVFRNVFMLMTLSQDSSEAKEFYSTKQKLLSIATTIEGVKKLREIKTAEIAECIQVLKIRNIIQRISSLKKEIAAVGDILNVSESHLKFESLEQDAIKLQSVLSILKKTLTHENDIRFLEKFRSDHPQISENIALNILTKPLSNLSCSLTEHPQSVIKEFFKYKRVEQILEDQFNNQPSDEFFDSINSLEELITAQMTFFLDKRIIEYTQDYAGELNTLKSIIKRKQKFPKELFANLKKAFPCILAGIRDYAEYIPLEKDLFDLIIIDEASQVSIAQALPALIRGRQLIVLGDDKQFSNVKANNASSVMNQQFKGRVWNAFTNEKAGEEDKFGWLDKVKDNFDIKNSILKFSRFIRNYDCQLKKHFRCYPEIISYSDKTFYANSLQCMKIRGKPIKEVIKFDVIEHDGKIDMFKNTNEMEADFIVEMLKNMDKSQTIGIITPHREQVTFLFDKINELPERDFLFDKCKMKIMTFDTCQGEERDYIFYSMVATQEKDRLKWIFPKDFSRIDDEIEGTIKAQRLNVGFSRAKECIHFVLSKKIEEFQGEIKNVLIHYQNELNSKHNRQYGGTDTNSPMEADIQQYLYETKFYKDNKERIEIVPQFPLGDYLKQLDRTYSHPAYKVDFLIILGEMKIVVEYDGFKEHFESALKNNEVINESNYKQFMSAEDVYRQKVLEGYGYRFIRVNKFNIGTNPIETLNDRLHDLVKKKSKIQLN
jgi:superfamily I DNA and/or RNA helicase/very-short-patch-repair endonuclease